MSESTPRRASSGLVAPTVSAGASTSGPRRLQANLKQVMETEIANQTYSFPSLELARMLSPKTPKRGVKAAGKLLRLHQYDCVVDELPFQAALDDAVGRLSTFTPQAAGSGESATYPSLAEFLTGCVRACHDALDRQDEFPALQNRWYRNLEFTVARNVVDGIDHASALRPDISGGNGISALREERLYWKPPPDKLTHRITLPVEVKNTWRGMVSQAATYARCLFGARPMRTFALVLAFNQKSSTLRFLVFHRGGLTASEEYDITRQDGLKEVTRFFLTLASWCTAEEAGVITCYSSTTYLLPKDEKGTSHVLAEVEDVLSWYHCIRGRMTFVSRLRLPGSVHPVVLEPLRRVPEPLVELGGLPLRRSARLLEEKSTTAETAGGGLVPGHSKGHRSRPLPPLRSMTTHKEEEAATAERADCLFFSPNIIWEQANCSVDGRIQTDPEVQLKYTQPEEIIRSGDDPILSDLTGTVVVKTSWPGNDRRSNEADMYRDSASRFGTIPHVCSYEGAGIHREVISNVLFVPQEDDVERYHWPIFTNIPPRKPEVRILKFTVFSTEGKSLVEAKSPRQLSRSWAHSLLGVFVDILQSPPTDLYCRMVVDIPIGPLAQGR